MLTLLVALPPVQVAGEQVALADKTVSGLAAIASRWPGRVVATSSVESVPLTANLGTSWHDMSSLGVEVVLGATGDVVRELRPDVVQLPLAVPTAALMGLAPTVVVAENTALMKYAYAATTSSPADRPRMLAGALRQEGVHRYVRRRAQGVACNGWGAWRAYGSGRTSSRTVKPILFFDNRIETGLLAAAPRGARAHDEVALAFSGRLHPSKGPQFAVDASRVLAGRGVPHRLHVLGDGPLRSALASSAGTPVTFHGDLPFGSRWIPFVRDEVDLMLLPHVQGDPSGTYLESAACGVPVLGFDNEAMRGHETFGGFARRATHRSAEGLADLVEELWSDTDARIAMAIAGKRFMQRENMDAEFDRRVDQLLRVASHGRRP